MTLYEILGVTKDATAEAIKRAYRKKANKAHPDKPDGDHQEMSAINEAYEILSDPAKRLKYDTNGTTSSNPVPTIDEIAMQSIAKAFDDMLLDQAPQGNIVQIIDKAIRESVLRYEFEIKKLGQYIARLDKKAILVSKKAGDGPDLWSDVVSRKRETYKAALDRAQLMRDAAVRSREILANYQQLDE